MRWDWLCVKSTNIATAGIATAGIATADIATIDVSTDIVIDIATDVAMEVAMSALGIYIYNGCGFNHHTGYPSLNIEC